MTAFELFVAEQLPGERYTTTRRTIKTKLAEKFSAIEMEVAQLYDAYERFYTSRTNSFRTHDIERYVAGLLRFNSGTPIDESADRVLAILVANGFLEVQGDIVDHVFRYSLRRMVDTYIAAKGTPSKIVLGCGHANTREMFECFGLPSETWCGCCKDLPHDDAMVVSLHELSADILCELNHLDLWEPLKDGSVDAIHDETWCLSCYRPETLDHIARVLRMGGEFVSNSYSIDAPIKDQMIERGFEVIEENLEQNTKLTFKCSGPDPKSEHPLIYLMVSKDEVSCPYCGTLYKPNTPLSTLNLKLRYR
jgi:uncharacterized Zn-finger protein